MEVIPEVVPEWDGSREIKQSTYDAYTDLASEHTPPFFLQGRA
jgi:hypothetical protein